jgi:hypothetical protein
MILDDLKVKANSSDLSFDDKKALPELLLKQQIAIIDRGLVISSFKTLERNRRMNNGVIGLVDKAVFESELAGLFLDVKDMIKSKKSFKLMSPYERDNYSNFLLLVNGKSFVLSDLVVMMGYVLRMLHVLNLTNLLINERNPFDDWKDSL